MLYLVEQKAGSFSISNSHKLAQIEASTPKSRLLVLEFVDLPPLYNSMPMVKNRFSIFNFTKEH